MGSRFHDPIKRTGVSYFDKVIIGLIAAINAIIMNQYQLRINTLGYIFTKMRAKAVTEILMQVISRVLRFLTRL